jgi:transcriptional regulator with XRE-family HTH domain
MLWRQRFANARGAKLVPTVNTSKLPIGQALKVERTVAGLGLGTVAALVGISAGYLSHLEKGDRPASPEMVERIRAAIARAA